MDHTTRMVIDCFKQISQIPRCSKQEQQISRWLQQWAKDRNLAAKSDAAGNLVIQVQATTGFEHAPVVVLQGHMDMVCEKSSGSNHDFSKDPIQLLTDGPWLTARETTLGADNGIAIALALALVDHPEVAHPPLELFFTVDEETGLTGATNMDPDLLTGRILINLDSEDEGVFIVGCAGGRDTVIQRTVGLSLLDSGMTLLGLSAHGMQGGHSGVDIAKHRANANKVMALLLSAGMIATPMRLVQLKGGSAKNVIPRSCEALVACTPDQVDVLERKLVSMAAVIKQDYQPTDPGLDIRIDRKGPVPADCHGVTETDTAVIVNLLSALPNGPAEMDPAFPMRVQTSANLAMVAIQDATLAVTSSQRSSISSRLDVMSMAVEAAGRLAEARVHTGKGYPPWPMNPNSQLLKRCTAVYRELFKTDPVVQVMHAGLECGVIGDRCPGMDMISLGPTMENPHSPSERLYLPSVEKLWRLMKALLESFKS